MGKAGDGASSQKRGSKKKKNTLEIDFYIPIFIDDFASPKSLKSIKDDKNLVPHKDSNLYLLKQLLKDDRPGGDKELFNPPLYLTGCTPQPRSMNCRSTLEEVERINFSIIAPSFGIGQEYSVIDNIQRAINYIQVSIRNLCFPKGTLYNLHFELFGAGRGAFVARTLAYLIDADDKYRLSEKQCKLFGVGEPNKKLFPLHNDDPTSYIKSKEIRIMGLFDTIACVGCPSGDELTDLAYKKIKSPLLDPIRKCRHETNVDDFGQYATESAKNLLHICAMDESRMFYPLIDISNSFGNGAEVFIPGSHNDIVGGYYGGENFVTRSASNLAEIITPMYDDLRKLFDDYNTTVCGEKHSDACRCELQNIKSLYPNDPDTALEGVEQMKKLAQFFSSYEGNTATLAQRLSSLQSLFDKEVAEREDRPREKLDKGKSQNEANSLREKLGQLPDIIDNINKMGLNRIIIRANQMWEACDESIKTTSSPELNAKWRDVRSGARSACQQLANLDLQISLLDSTKKKIKEFRDKIKDVKDWAFGDTAPEVVFNKNIPTRKPKDDELLPISKKTMQMLGWMPEKDLEVDEPDRDKNKKTDYTTCFADGENGETPSTLSQLANQIMPLHGALLCKTTLKGYSMIPLKAMYEWLKGVDSKMVQSSFPKEYKIPYMVDMSSAIVNMAKMKKRSMVLPDSGTTDTDNYRMLRCKHLQFEMYDLSPVYVFSMEAANYDTESFPDKNVITRRVYEGKKGSTTKQFMYDLAFNNIDRQNRISNISDDHWIVVAADGGPSDFKKYEDDKRRQEQEAMNAEPSPDGPPQYEVTEKFSLSGKSKNKQSQTKKKKRR